jgi:hypothetical protein
MKQTIAQQLQVTEFPFSIRDKHGMEIYYEDSDGHYVKRQYDSNGNETYYESLSGWAKREYNSLGNQIYFENSAGRIIDDRLKAVELTLEQIADKFDIEVKQLKIKK